MQTLAKFINPLARGQVNQMVHDLRIPPGGTVLQESTDVTKVLSAWFTYASPWDFASRMVRSLPFEESWVDHVCQLEGKGHFNREETTILRHSVPKKVERLDWVRSEPGSWRAAIGQPTP